MDLKFLPNLTLSVNSRSLWAQSVASSCPIDQPAVCDTWAAWNHVASCGSSTTEDASDVSLFHTCLTFPLALAGGCLVVGLCLVGVFVCFPGFASAKVVYFVSTSRVLDDRQCFTARSARHKKRNNRAPTQPAP